MKNGEFLYETVTRLGNQMYDAGEPAGETGSKIHMNPEDYLSFKAYFNGKKAEGDAETVLSGPGISYRGYLVVSDEMLPPGKVVARQVRSGL